ncbi:MAG: chorismate synthase [Methylocystaceae bacterium]
MLRYLTAGESHGLALTAVVEGLPAGLPVTAGYINKQLARRQMGYGRGGRMKIEKDEVKILSGVRAGLTLGSPVTLQVANRDWDNWQAIMGAETADTSLRQVTVPRPGHGDLAGSVKYGHRDMRNILERASARETAARVAACTLGRCLLEQIGCEVLSQVTRIGEVTARSADLDDIRIKVPQSELGCADPEAENHMKSLIDAARDNGDTLGGIFEIIVTGLPIGLGSHVQWDRRLDGRLAGAVMSIQAIKGVEIGLGFAVASLPGSRVHDAILPGERGLIRPTNHAGGLEAGITNGQPLVVRAAMKPIATLMRPLNSVDLTTGHQAPAATERSDICAVPAAAVVAEAVVAFELAIAVMEKYGGDSMDELTDRIKRGC